MLRPLPFAFALPLPALVTACGWLAASLVACGSANDSPADAGAVPDATTGPTTTDGGADADAAGDSAPPDAGDDTDANVPLPGQLIAQDSYVLGWTNDGFLVYGTGALGGAVHALGADGGSQTVTEALPDGGRITAAVGTTGAFLYYGDTPKSTLGLWTGASGYRVLAQGAYDGVSFFQQSPDGTKAMYFVGSSAPGSQVVVENADGTNPQTINGGDTAEDAFFSGSNGLVFTTVTTLADAGALNGLQIWAGTPLTQVAEVQGTELHIGPDFATVVTVDTQGNGWLVRASDGSEAQFASGITSGTIKDFTFDTAGTNLYYVVGGALKHTVVASPATASTVVTTGVTDILALSWDGTSLLYDDGVAYYVVASSGASSPVLVATATGGLDTFTGGFTADSTHVFCKTAYQPGSGYAFAASLRTGGAATATWTGVYDVNPLLDTRVLVFDAQQNLSIADADGKVATRPLASQVSATAVSPDRKHVAFTANLPQYATETSVLVPVN